MNIHFCSFRGQVPKKSIAKYSKTKPQIPLISLKNDFVFEDKGIRVFRHKNIGPGTLIKVKKFHQSAEYDCELVTGGEPIKINKNTPVEAFIPENLKLKPIRNIGQEYTIPKNVFDRTPNEDEVKDYDETAVHSCQRPFCIAEFPTNYQLQEHLDSGKCYEAMKKQPIGDYIRVRYFMHFGSMNAGQGGAKFMTHLKELNCPSIPSSLLSSPIKYEKEELIMGFALKGTAKQTKITDDQKRFLYTLYVQGGEEKQKFDAATAHDRMRDARIKVDGVWKKRFWNKQYLKVSTIKNLFGSFTANLKNGKPENFTFEEVTAQTSQEAMEEGVLDNQNLFIEEIRAQTYDNIHQNESATGESDDDDGADPEFCPILVSIVYKLHLLVNSTMT